MKNFALIALLAATLIACDEPDEVFEKVDKLRAFGISTTPLVSEPSTPAAPKAFVLTFFVALPKGDTISSAESFLDGASRFAPPVLMTVDPASIVVEPHAAFDIASIKASIAVPPAELTPFAPDAGFARLRYGLRITSGGEEEKIVGTVLVYPPGAPELAWNATPPATDISAPAANAAVGDDEALVGAIANPIGETMRVAWYVSSGTLLNRRARETKWKEPDGGPQTVIFTARGSKSGAFSYKVVDVGG